MGLESLGLFEVESPGVEKSCCRLLFCSRWVCF